MNSLGLRWREVLTILWTDACRFTLVLGGFAYKLAIASALIIAEFFLSWLLTYRPSHMTAIVNFFADVVLMLAACWFIGVGAWVVCVEAHRSAKRLLEELR